MDTPFTAALERISAATDIPAETLWQAVAGADLLMNVAHTLAVQGGWWHDIHTGEDLQRNKGELICLMHSELSEMMEGERKGLADDKLPHRRMAEVELADVFVRGGDYARGFGYDVIGAMVEKMAFNLSREDHKPENRAKAGGKVF